MERTILIVNKLGLHARAAAKLVTLAQKFKCEIHAKKDGREVSGKSIMGVMMLAAGMGSTVEVETTGPDEQVAMNALLALINDRFGEGE
jgi:phosphocarrier protein HPr